jgi:acetyl-CoA carboxylase biotin carboxyl carrier protein
MIDLKFLEKLLEMLNSSQAGAIEVRKNLWSTTIRVSKDTALSHQGPVTYHVGSTSSSPLPPLSSPVGSGSREEGGGVAAEPAEVAVERPALLHEIKSPMVGTYYAQPEPGAEPYVRVGSRIGPGQTLCIIEAMKIMNPIDAEVSGVIAEVCVQDSQPVEFGQVLFRVDTNG